MLNFFAFTLTHKRKLRTWCPKQIPKRALPWLRAWRSTSHNGSIQGNSSVTLEADPNEKRIMWDQANHMQIVPCERLFPGALRRKLKRNGDWHINEQALIFKIVNSYCSRTWNHKSVEIVFYLGQRGDVPCIIRVHAKLCPHPCSGVVSAMAVVIFTQPLLHSVSVKLKPYMWWKVFGDIAIKHANTPTFSWHDVSSLELPSGNGIVALESIEIYLVVERFYYLGPATILSQSKRFQFQCL